MSKSLSNGTLSLRFMQNALRRQNLQEVELKRAEIKDEGKWEVGQDVRDAWRIGGESSDSVVHESSYLPFLFSSELEDTAARISKPRGRRMFNKHGLDVSQDQSQPQPERDDTDDDDNDDNASGGEDATVTTGGNDDSRSQGYKDRVHTVPAPIDESSLDDSNLQGADTFDTSNKTGRNSKSARDAIFSLSGVGTDLRSAKKSLTDNLSSQDHEQKPKQQERGLPSSTGFLKPMGVDEPTARNPTSISPSKTKTLKSSVPNVIDGARKKKKRTRDPNEPEAEEKKKRKIQRSILSRPPDEE